jgi:DNA-binding response OmpR family regulator
MWGIMLNNSSCLPIFEQAYRYLHKNFSIAMDILIVEDEKELLNSMDEYLSGVGMKCTKAENLDQALSSIAAGDFNCILLDIGLPDGSGFKVIEAMQKKEHTTGILIISARNSLDDRLTGLNIGADDYITKPFHMSELIARINSVSRRRASQDRKAIIFQELKLVPDEMVMYIGEKMVTLTKKEHELMVYLINNPDRVLTKEAIAEHLWGDHSDIADSFDFIYSHIKNLRKKIVDNGGKDYIHSVYGVGYKFTNE